MKTDIRLRGTDVCRKCGQGVRVGSIRGKTPDTILISVRCTQCSHVESFARDKRG